MAYLARYKHGPKNYLASPFTFYGAGKIELWHWSPDRKKAHRFASRKAAKEKLRELRGQKLGYFKMSDFTFEPSEGK